MRARTLRASIERHLRRRRPSVRRSPLLVLALSFVLPTVHACGAPESMLAISLDHGTESFFRVAPLYIAAFGLAFVAQTMRGYAFGVACVLFLQSQAAAWWREDGAIPFIADGALVLSVAFLLVSFRREGARRIRSLLDAHFVYALTFAIVHVFVLRANETLQIGPYVYLASVAALVIIRVQALLPTRTVAPQDAI